MIFHDPGCHARGLVQRARCTCGAIPDDPTSPLSCPGCEVEIRPGGGWLHSMIVEQRAYLLVTCTSEVCMAQAHAIGWRLLTTTATA